MARKTKTVIDPYETEIKVTALSAPAAAAPEDPDQPTASNAMMVLFGDIVIDDNMNVRKTYDGKRIASLALSIKTQGQLDPFLVAPRSEDGKYHLISGFRRARAHKLIHGDKAPEILVPANVKRFRNADDALIANLAFDEGREPVKRYELADRLAYMSGELGYKGIDLAKKINMSNATVSNLIACRNRLAQEVLDVWKSAPSPDQEIPISRLVEWSQFPVEDQLAALEAYMSLGDESDDEDENSGDGGAGDGEPKDRKKKKTILMKPRSKKNLVAKLDEFRERETAGEEFSEAEAGAFKCLRWVLQETKTLRF